MTASFSPFLLPLQATSAFRARTRPLRRAFDAVGKGDLGSGDKCQSCTPLQPLGARVHRQLQARSARRSRLDIRQRSLHLLRSGHRSANDQPFSRCKARRNSRCCHTTQPNQETSPWGGNGQVPSPPALPSRTRRRNSRRTPFENHHGRQRGTCGSRAQRARESCGRI